MATKKGTKTVKSIVECERNKYPQYAEHCNVQHPLVAEDAKRCGATEKQVACKV